MSCAYWAPKSTTRTGRGVAGAVEAGEVEEAEGAVAGDVTVPG